MLEVVRSENVRKNGDKRRKKVSKKNSKKQSKKSTKTTDERIRGDNIAVVEIYEDLLNRDAYLPGWFDHNTLPPLPDTDMTEVLGDGQSDQTNKFPPEIDYNITDGDKDYELDIPDELTEDQNGFHIVGGGTVSLQEYLDKYQMVCSVLKKQKILGVDYIVHSCGCTMISPTIALTAAHCVEYAHYVKAGKLYRKTSSNEQAGLEEETFKVKKARKHPDYDSIIFSHDVAILKLDKLVGKEKTDNIATLQLSKYKIEEKEERTIVGWGYTNFGSQTPSEVLRHGIVEHMTTSDCVNDYYKDKGLVDDSMFCAYAPGKDACQGDSGGPIFRKDTNGKLIQIGIISWGYKCGIWPGVYTNLSDESISKFIQKAVCKGRGKDKDVCKSGKLKNSI